VNDAVRESVRAKIAVALESVAHRPGGGFSYGFALYPDRAPDDPSRRCMWVQTSGSERMPLTVEMVRATADDRVSLWLYGTAAAAIDISAVQGLHETVRELVLHVLVGPYGRPHDSRHYSELRTLVRTTDMTPAQPYVFVCRPTRPRGWPR